MCVNTPCASKRQRGEKTEKRRELTVTKSGILCSVWLYLLFAFILLAMWRRVRSMEPIAMVRLPHSQSPASRIEGGATP